MKQLFIILSIMFLSLLKGQTTFTATYTAGDIPTSYNIYSNTCNGPVTTLAITLPSTGPFTVSNVAVSYSMTAVGVAYMSDQRSMIKFQNTNTEEAEVSGVGNTTGIMNYNRNLSIANGTYPGGTVLIFQMKARRTFEGTPGCNGAINKVNNHSWTITISGSDVGRVGIGTSTPTEKLDVAGNIKTSGEIKPNGNSGTANEVLTSNGDGTMSWAAMSSSTGSSGNSTVAGAGSWGNWCTDNVVDYQPIANAQGEGDDIFGSSVAISGDYAIIGSYYDNEGFTRQGSVSFYKKNASSGAWEQLGPKMLNNSPEANDQFGISVAMSGDYAVVGANNDSEIAANQGSVTIFKKNASTGLWEQDGSKLFHAYPSANDKFGFDVAISGDHVIVGTPFDDEDYIDQGSVSIFKKNASTGVWEPQGGTIFNASPAANDWFGISVSISGAFAIAGALLDDEGFTDQGSASIFKRNASLGVWEQQGPKLLNSLPQANDDFGKSVSISGDYAIVGSPEDDEAFSNQGSVTIFKKNTVTGIWDQHGPKLLNSLPSSGDIFGESVCISGEYAIVGAIWDNNGGVAGQGSVTIFRRQGNIWRSLQRFANPAAQTLGFFGAAVSIDASNRRFLVGANGEQSFAGMAYFGMIR